MSDGWEVQTLDLFDTPQKADNPALDSGTNAARAILRVAAIKESDHAKTAGVPELAEHGRKLSWLIRELRRAAHWAASGHDPGDGSTHHSCKQSEVVDDGGL